MDEQNANLGAEDAAVGVMDPPGPQSGDKLQEAASTVVDRAKETTQTQLSSRMGQASETIGQFAHAVRQTGQTMREQDQGAMGMVADRAAEQIERAAGYLRGKQANDVLRDAEDFARREPIIFLGGGLALGWFVARFLKSGPPSQESGPPSQESGDTNDASAWATREYKRRRRSRTDRSRSDEAI